MATISLALAITFAVSVAFSTAQLSPVRWPQENELSPTGGEIYDDKRLADSNLMNNLQLLRGLNGIIPLDYNENDNAPEMKRRFSGGIFSLKKLKNGKRGFTGGLFSLKKQKVLRSQRAVGI